MFIHMVFWKFSESHRNDLAEAVERLRSLKRDIPFLVALHAGVNQVHSERSWDLGLFVGLPDRAHLGLYDQHPAHQEVRAWIRQRALQSASVDFEDPTQ